MKLKFEKPIINKIEIQLTTSICNCDNKVGNNYYEDLYSDWGLFFDQCNEKVIDGTVFEDGHCYHTSQSSVFSS